MEDHENDIHMQERDELEDIFLRQPAIMKHNLPVEPLGILSQPKEDPVFDLKPLPDTLKYAYLDEKKVYPVIINSNLSWYEEERLLETLRRHQGAIGYTLDDLKGISPSICQHIINLEPDAKPVVDHQRRLNPKMKGVVRTVIEAKLSRFFYEMVEIYYGGDNFHDPTTNVRRRCALAIAKP